MEKYSTLPVLNWEDNFKNIGVYVIRNLITGKIYIGSTISGFNKRKNCHFSELRRGIHDNIHLQNSFNKRGEDVFVFEIIEICSKEDVITREQYWIDKTGCLNNKIGYNIFPFAWSGAGVKLSYEHGQKIAAANRRRIVSDETKAKMSVSSSFRNLSPESHKKRKINRLVNDTFGKINWEIAFKIRALWKFKIFKRKELAEIYNLTKSSIGNVTAERTWKTEDYINIVLPNLK